ncbi:hypothetical protein UlMin_031983 [Ulmus minor]
MERGRRRHHTLMIVFLVVNAVFSRPSGPYRCTETRKREIDHVNDAENEVHVGVILDMDSIEAKIVHSCISMSLADFYTLHTNYYTKLVLHTRDSKRQPLLALSSGIDLLNNVKVKALIGGQTTMEAKFLAELGNKAEVPVISLAGFNSLSPFNSHPFFVQITHDHEISQFKGIAAIVEAFKWKEVVLIYEDSDDVVSSIIESFQESNIHIAYRSAIAASYREHDERLIHKELHKLKTLQSTVFIVHMKLGMMKEGYVWFMTSNTMNSLLHLVDSNVMESMQGVIGFKSNIPTSKALLNLTSALRRKFYMENPSVEVIESSPHCVWAYDSTWALAEAVERAKLRSSKHGSTLLLQEMLESRFMGLSGKFEFRNGKLIPNGFEMVNVIGKSWRRVGFWKDHEKESKKESLSPNDFEAIIWPGGSTKIPKAARSLLSETKLRVGLPVVNNGFTELMQVHHDPHSNITNATGFCVEVFKAALNLLPYQVQYEFELPTVFTRDLIYQVYDQHYDVAVGDVSITSNRSLYVDFTIPFTDLGVGMVVRNDEENMWIFLKPLSVDLWITTTVFFIFTGIVVWVIERPSNQDFQGSTSEQIGTILWFSFSTLVFAHREKLLSNLSKFVVIIWVFVVLILTSSYTATLTSMMTVHQMQLHEKGNYIGYQIGSFTPGVLSNVNYKGFKTIHSPEEYADALTRGSKHGGVSAIIDEIPYIKIFLARYLNHYSMIKTISSSNGFGFAFRKGSPLVDDMSWAIAKLREEGKLANLEKIWFHSISSLSSLDSANGEPIDALDLYSFGGLFLVTGASSILALLLSLVFAFRRRRMTLRSLLIGV